MRRQCGSYTQTTSQTWGADRVTVYPESGERNGDVAGHGRAVDGPVLQPEADDRLIEHVVVGPVTDHFRRVAPRVLVADGRSLLAVDAGKDERLGDRPDGLERWPPYRSSRGVFHGRIRSFYSST